MERAKTVEQYIELINQAIFEVEELRHTIEYDHDSMGGAADFVNDLERGVRHIHELMEEGEYQFEDADLPFMSLVQHQDDMLLPFKHLLYVINATHRKGLDIDSD